MKKNGKLNRGIERERSIFGQTENRRGRRGKKTERWRDRGRERRKDRELMSESVISVLAETWLLVLPHDLERGREIPPLSGSY